MCYRSPAERDVLSRLPPNTLELLAMMGCDDGALLGTSIEKSPDDPNMLGIKTWTKTTALQSMNWMGFDSSQL